jgi:hypothetical protein
MLINRYQSNLGQFDVITRNRVFGKLRKQKRAVAWGFLRI